MLTQLHIYPHLTSTRKEENKPKKSQLFHNTHTHTKKKEKKEGGKEGLVKLLIVFIYSLRSQHMGGPYAGGAPGHVP